jgi:hypothetical protein
MNLFTKMKRKRIEKRFLRKDLSIIQSVPKTLFHEIITQLSSRGWEVTCDYQGEEGWTEKGKCKVRKGVSTLDFEWNKKSLGSITGLDRIISDIANEFSLTKRRSPKW